MDYEILGRCLLTLLAASTLVSTSDTQDAPHISHNRRTRRDIFRRSHSDSSPSSGCHFHLQTLRCRDTGLPEIESKLSNVTSISTSSASSINTSVIDIFRCQVKTLGEKTFANVSAENRGVTELRLTSSNLSYISPKAFSPFSSTLVNLDLSDNLLDHVPSSLSVLGNLARVNLAGNRISNLNQDVFINLKRLTSFRLDRNHLHLLEPGEIKLLPLRDSLEQIYMRGNKLKNLPTMFGETFKRLREIDLSYNLITDVPPTTFSSMPELSIISLDDNKLQNVILEPLGGNVQLISLLNNPLNCDCKSLWLWNLANDKSSRAKVSLPPCFSPFSRKNSILQALKGGSLCHLSETNRIPKFFRVTDQDLDHFPDGTFTSLDLDNVSILSENALNVTFHVDLQFYYNEYDWGVIYREIGAGSSLNNMFYKTNFNLRDYASNNDAWSPGDEEFSVSVKAMKMDQYYEVCLAVIENGLTYYIHRDHCREIRMTATPAPLLPPPLLPHNVTFIRSVTSVTATWNITGVTGVTGSNKALRRIVVKEFATNNNSQVFVMENFNETSEDGPRFYTVEGLKPNTGYTVCFQTIDIQGSSKSYGNKTAGQDNDWVNMATRLGTNSLLGGDMNKYQFCEELLTLEDGFPVREVAAATAVSTSTTAVVVALVCCCCPPCRKKSGDKESLDVNDNEKKTKKNDCNHHAHEQNHQAEDKDAIFHERYTAAENRSDHNCGNRFWRKCLEQGSGRSSSDSSNQEYDYNCHQKDDMELEPMTGQSSSIRSDTGNCVSGSARSVKGQCRSGSVRSKCVSGSVRSVKGQCKAKSNSVRSGKARSLSSKYSDRNFEETRRYLKKNESLCITPQQDHKTCNPDPPLPPRLLPDGTRITPGVPGTISSKPASNRISVHGSISSPSSGCHYHTFSHYQFYKHPIPLQYYTPPQPDYMRNYLPPDLKRSYSHKDYMPGKKADPSHSRNTINSVPIELRPVKLKKSFKKTKHKDENYKMYTWSPYSNSLFYSDPSAGKEYPDYPKRPKHEEMRF